MTNSKLVTLLERSKAEGFLGPGPLEVHIDRAAAFVELAPQFSGAFLDLGSGGGLPGLVLVEAWPEATGVLLDGSTRRCAFLAEAVEYLGAADRIRVVAARAEDAGRTDLRESFDLVVARSFAAPPVTAECAAPFLVVGGRLAVAEPPEASTPRWDDAGLQTVGFRSDGLGPSTAARIAVFTKESATPERFPRRVGVPSKRPLWSVSEESTPID